MPQKGMRVAGATRLLTLNLNGHGAKHGPWPRRRELVLELLRAQAPDVVALQAVAMDAGSNQAAELAEQLPEYRYAHSESAVPGAAGLGCALLSRWPLHEPALLRFPAHAGSEDPGPRVALRARAALAQRSLQVCSAHVSWVPEQAARQLGELGRWLSGLAGDVVLAGDLNTPSGSPLLEPLLAAGLHDVWETLRGEEPGPTFESDAPTLRIDFIFASAALTPRAVQIERAACARDGVRLSDHLALAACFAA
jgi:endonuclease/exonuclease/phosphatase family metal-dependent hydrolase